MVKILILEHDPYDLELLINHIEDFDFEHSYQIADNREAYILSLTEYLPDIILSVFNLPSFNGLEAYRIKQNLQPRTPFIIVSGTIGEETAVRLIREGITDFVPKDKLFQIEYKVARALEEARNREQKVALESHLKKGNIQLQRIMNWSLDMICIFNREAQIVQVSAASKKLLGYSPEELAGTRMLDYIFPNDLEKTLAIIPEVLDRQRSTFENRYLRKDGTIVYLSWTMQWDENEQMVYCVARDVTEVKRSELKLAEYNEALRSSEEQYRELFEFSPFPMWVYHADSLRFLKVNDAALRQYGYSREEFLSMTVMDIRPVWDRQKVQNIINQTKRTKELHNGKYKHLKKNGEEIDVFVQSNTIYFEGSYSRIVVATDITEREKHDRILQESENKFKALVHEGSDLINVLDSQGKYIYANPACGQLLGIDPTDLVGRDPLDFVHPEHKQTVISFKAFLTKVKRVKSPPYLFLSHNGEYRWIQSIATNLMDDPAVCGIVINSKDITESIQHSEAIEKQNVKLREISWVQSHIVRAPLCRIMGLTELLKDYSADPEARELFGHLLSSANELDEVIKDIVKRAEVMEEINSEYLATENNLQPGVFRK